MKCKIHSKIDNEEFEHEASFHANEQMKITYTYHTQQCIQHGYDFRSSEKHNKASTTSASCSALRSC